MNDLDFHIGRLVITNRILTNEGIGRCIRPRQYAPSMHSERYLLSWSRSPELVERADIMEFTLVVRMSVYVPRNARGLMAAMRRDGEVKGLSHGEIAG